MRKQHAPFSVQLELVEGCNLCCAFCGINGIRKRPGNYKFASLKTIHRVASELSRLGWQPRVEFAMHGEPSLHKQYVTAIKIIRSKLPSVSIMMTTNGIGFLGDKVKNVDEAKKAGLNVLAIDQYNHSNISGILIGKIKKTYPKEIIKWYPDDSKASVYRKRNSQEFDIVVMRDITTLSGGNHRLANHAGAASPKDYGRKHVRCAQPFRDLAIRWDGNVSLCCDDWRGEYKVGNVHDMALDELWNHPRFDAARRRLYHNGRDFNPCLGCNAVSHRVGLLPDPTGQEEMPEPNNGSDEALKEALEGKPYTKPVVRPWE